MKYLRVGKFTAILVTSLVGVAGGGWWGHGQLELAPRPAAACGNGVRESFTKKEAIALIKKIEEQLSNGQDCDARHRAEEVLEADYEGDSFLKKSDEKLESRMKELLVMSRVHCGLENEAQGTLTQMLQLK